MKPLYQKFETAKADAILTFNLVALLAEAQAELQAASLDRLCVRLVRPRISGALLLSTKNFAGNYITLNDDEVVVHVAALPEGKNRLTIEAEFGTNTRTLAIVDIFTTANEAGVFEPEAIITPVVKQVCDGVGVTPAELAAALAPIEVSLAGKADGQVYRVGESGDPAVRDVAKIIGHGLEVGTDAEATGLNAVAIGGAIASGEGALAVGCADKSLDGMIIANGDGGLALGRAQEGQIVAESSGSLAHGRTNGGQIIAEGEGGQAFGVTDGDAYIDAAATGSAAFGEAIMGSIVASTAGSIAFGKVEDLGVINAGTDPATELQGMACIAGGIGKEAYKITAGSDAAIAIGYALDGDVRAVGRSSVAIGTGPINAIGESSFAMGTYCEANSDFSFLYGRGIVANDSDMAIFGSYNIIEDTYAFAIGNGTSDQNRRNSFAIDRDGNLVLFNNGTPVVLTPAKLAQLIA